MLRNSSAIAAFVCVFLLCQNSVAATRWVGNGGNDDASGSSYGARWENLSVAVRRLNTGDTLIVTNGSYDFINDEGDSDGIIRVGGSYPYESFGGRLDGWTNNYTTIRAQNPGGVFIRGNLHFAGSYINVDGLTIHGSFPDGSGGYYHNDSPGLFFMDSHHINVTNCEVAYCGGGGINFNHSDSIRVVGNHTHHNGLTNPDQHSGISVYQPIAFADPEGRYWRIEIRRNSSHDNINYNPHPQNGITDGNGIILDDYRYTQQTYLGGRNGSTSQYQHRTLVECNVCTYNGGSGIQVYESVDVTVKNNTCIGNRQYTFDANGNFINDGQVSLRNSWGCHVLNNVMQSRYVQSAPYKSPYAASETQGGLNLWQNNLLHSTVTWNGLWNNSNIDSNVFYLDPQFANESIYDFTSTSGYDKASVGRGILTSTSLELRSAATSESI